MSDGETGQKLIAHIDDLLAAYAEQHMLGQLSTPNFRKAISILQTLRRLTLEDKLISARNRP